MEFRILGPLEVWSNGQQLALGRGRQKALLALLLLHANRVVSRDRLIDELWGDDPPATVDAALLNYVSRLRRLLGDGRLESRAPGYQLRVAADELDAARFEHLVKERRFERALALWRGPALAEFRSEPFAQPEAARLEELRLHAVEERIAQELDEGRHSDVVGELEALTTEFPLRERFRSQLMLALYRAGRQADALRVFRQARQTLIDDLGIEPSAELQRLERAILMHDPALAAPSGASSEEGPSRTAADEGVPTGTVTFLFTDIEDSTGLVRILGDDYAALLVGHHRILGEAFGAHGGHEVDRQGDALFFSFRRARDAVKSAIAAQREIARARWPQDAEVRVRIGVHTGEPGIAEGRYHGLDVVRAARIAAAAHGGQILVSNACRTLLPEEPPDGLTLRDIGEHRLKGFDRPERLFQVEAEGLPRDFPPLRTARAEKLDIAGREDELATAAAKAALRPVERGRRDLLRRRASLAAALAALVLGAVSAVVLFIRPGPAEQRGLSGLAAHSIGLVDANSNRLIAQVPLGRSVRHLAVGEHGVWVAKLPEEILLRIDPRTRRVAASFGIGEPLTGLAVGEDAIWAITIRGTLMRIDPLSGRPVRRVLLKGDRPPTASDLEYPPRISADESGLWVSSGRTVWHVDPASGGVVARYTLKDVITGIAAGEGAVWAVDFSDTLTRIDPAADAIVGRTELPADPIGVAAGAGAVWITGPAHNVVWRVDPLTDRVAHTIETGYRPWVIAVGAGDVWVTSWQDRTVQRIDPGANRVVATIRIGNAPVDLATSGDEVWVAVAGRFPAWPEPVATG